MISKKTIEEFRIVTSKKIGHKISLDEAEEILRGVVGYLDTLARIAYKNGITPGQINSDEE